MKKINSYNLFILIFILVIFTSISNCSEIDQTFYNHPDSKKSDYYSKNKNKIDHLSSKFLDTTNDAKTRLDSFEELKFHFPDAAIFFASKLTSDSSKEIAQVATQILADSIVMSDHSVQKNNLTPRKKYMISRNEDSRKALRNAIEDSRKEIREIAAGSLASLSDEKGIKRINEGVKKGIYSDSEAVNYFGLTNPDIGSKYILPYLENKDSDPTALTAAVTYMGAIPEFQEKVRDNVFLNPSADPDSKSAAAKTLGKYDPNFLSYGLDTNLPVDVFSVSVGTYINKTITKPKEKFNALEFTTIQQSVDKYLAIQPNSTKLETLKKDLERHKKELGVN